MFLSVFLVAAWATLSAAAFSVPPSLDGRRIATIAPFSGIVQLSAESCTGIHIDEVVSPIGDGHAGFPSAPPGLSTRRNALQLATLAALSAGMSSPLSASAAPTKSGTMNDLPSEASRSYLQYRVTLQIAADFYIFELQDLVGRIEDWEDINQLARAASSRGGGQPSRIERDFVNPMRILSLSMPPESSDTMRDAQFAFEGAMARLTKATFGARRDLPVEIEKGALPTALASWEEGRVALGEFFAALNEATGLDEMRSPPAAGPNQIKEYGRSPRKYNDLVKKLKLCQNRGGPALSQAWGKLMTSGYLQDSCGIPDMEAYFYQ